MSKKFSTLSSFMVLFILVLSACGGAAPPATEPPATQVPATTAPTATTVPTSEPTATEAATAEPDEVFPPEVKAVITIKLPEGATWSDGTAVTSKDLVGTWDILWMRKNGTWDSLADVVAKDDQTVQFQITNPGPAVLDAIVRSTAPRPYSQYGKWMDQAATFRADGSDLQLIPSRGKGRIVDAA